MRTLLMLTILLSLSSPALADITGQAGRLVGLRDAGTGSDSFSLSQGSIWVEERSKIVQVYHWGGSNCPAKDLAEAEVANLSRALNNGSLRIVPIYLNGQLPDSRCVVEFILIDLRQVESVETALGAL